VLSLREEHDNGDDDQRGGNPIRFGKTVGGARADGSFRNLLARLSRIDVPVIDDWAMAPLSEPERRDFWEICEDRYQVRSLILTSQLPVARWHEQIGDPTVADGILDRLVHNAHRIEMRGDSMRKNRGKPNCLTA
jgi:DNA replication protein DnaC